MTRIRIFFLWLNIIFYIFAYKTWIIFVKVGRFLAWKTSSMCPRDIWLLNKDRLLLGPDCLPFSPGQPSNKYQKYVMKKDKTQFFGTPLGHFPFMGVLSGMDGYWRITRQRSPGRPSPWPLGIIVANLWLDIEAQRIVSKRRHVRIWSFIIRTDCMAAFKVK